jgi:hypothetical protein
MGTGTRYRPVRPISAHMRGREDYDDIIMIGVELDGPDLQVRKA